MRTPSNVVTIALAGPSRWASMGLFNPNGFPEPLETHVRDCSTRYAQFLLQANDVPVLLSLIEDEFLKDLDEKLRQHGCTKEYLKAHPVPHIVSSDGVACSTAIYNVLHALKSLLDMYAGLIAKLFVPDAWRSFGKGKVGGQELSGGKVINWLRSCTPEPRAQAKSVAAILERHSRSWITTAVGYRDRLAHKGELPGMTHLHLPLHAEASLYRVAEVVRPRMPDNMPLESYVGGMSSQLEALLKESLRVLPSVDTSKLSL